MAETPLDIIMKHLTAERESVALGNDPADTHDLAIAIAMDLKESFRISRPPAPWATDAETFDAVPPVPRAPIVLTPPIPEPLPANHTDITVRAENNPMLFYIGTDRTAYRLDDVTVPNSMGFPHGREAQIALALTDISASRLHEVTK